MKFNFILHHFRPGKRQAKRFGQSGFGIVLLSWVTVLFLTLPSIASAEDDICWRETEGRGVGTIPRQCDLVEERKAFTCYENCRDGYTGLIAKCRMDCPEGFKEGALNYCVKSENYRVAGFPWKAGDGLGRTKLNKAKQRCEARHGRGECVLRQSAWYPSCREGFSQAGINICTQACPRGWETSGNRCLRPNYVRSTSKPECGPGQIQEPGGGLCRNECPSGFNGVGPVCWAECPAAFPERCGMACATSRSACAMAITDQVLSVLESAAQIALMVVTAGGSSAATAPAGAAASGATTVTTTTTNAASTTAMSAARAGASRALSAAGRQLAKLPKEQIEAVLKDVIKDPALYAGTLEAIVSISAGEGSDEAAGDKALEILAAVDPTGLMGIVDAYKKPMCPID